MPARSMPEVVFGAVLHPGAQTTAATNKKAAESRPNDDAFISNAPEIKVSD